MRTLLVLPVLATSAHLVTRHERNSARDTRGRLRSGISRVAQAFRKFNADNVALWERYLRAQRPWLRD